MLTKTSNPAQSAVPLETAKLHARVDQDYEDSVLAVYLASAIDECARYSGLAINQQDYRLTLDCLPACIDIPIKPVVAVTSVKYLDEDGAEQTIAAENYVVAKTSQGARITFIDDYTRPTTASRPACVFVDLEAGFDADDGSSGIEDPELKLPACVEQAILVTFGHYYANRETVTQGKTPVAVPRSAEWLLDLVKVYR
jgi:uncharacterized phiE125 gp8 family phage protein